MELLRIYSCLCDLTRLRILHLLSSGPLCVCHFQELLKEPRVKISKHLNYLKVHGLVAARREANWMIYSLSEKQSKELRANLACLQDCANGVHLLRRDRHRLSRMRSKFEEKSPICSASPSGKTRKRNA